MEQYKRKFEEGFRAMDFGPIKNAVYKILMDHTSKSDAIPTGREISESIILGISDSQLPKEEVNLIINSMINNFKKYMNQIK